MPFSENSSGTPGPGGLSSAEALRRLALHGPNELPGARQGNLLRMLRGIVLEPMFLLLLACGATYMALGDVHEALMLLAFIAVTAVLGTSRLRGFIALAIGLAIGLVGIDSVSGQPRLTFGIPQLGDGIDVVVVAVGVFAVGEALWVAAVCALLLGGGALAARLPAGGGWAWLLLGLAAAAALAWLALPRRRG